MDQRAQRRASPLAGVARGRNVILISAESFPAFAVGLSIHGQPVAPHFTAFARESLQFTDYYEQTHRNTTSDAELMALNSLLPLRRGAVATRYEGNTFRALPHVLAEHGYTTFSACGEPPTFWNMRQIHQRYGFQQSKFLPDFAMTEWIGAGLADDAFLSQAGAAISDLPEPFFAFLLTSSNHHPWYVPEPRRLLRPGPLADTAAGGYLQSIRFADEAFGSVLVVYGDHRAELPPQSLDRLWTATGHTTPPTPLESWRFERRVPLLIRLPYGQAAGSRDVPGGHLDIAPTLTTLLGVEASDAPWFGRDLTSPAPRLVAFRDGEMTTGPATVVIHDGTPSCVSNDGTSVSCDRLTSLIEDGQRLFARSDRIIEGNLIPILVARLRASSGPPPPARPRVLVIAHRGDSAHFPENTAAAIEASFEAGADMVEIDVRLSRDGVPIVFHDDTLDRTTDRRGVPEGLSLREFKALDAGSWKGRQFAHVPPLTLAEAITLAGGPARLYFDIKNDGLAAPIAALFAQMGVTPATATVGVWTPAQAAEFRQQMPGARLVRMLDPPSHWSRDLFAQTKAEGFWGIELGDAWPASFVGDAQANDVPVWAYTVNDTPTMARLVELGVSGIETDDPATLVSVLTRLGLR